MAGGGRYKLVQDMAVDPLNAAVLKLPGALSAVDEGKTVEIKGDILKVGGEIRKVRWDKAKHDDCVGTIVSVNTAFKGKVTLTDSNSGKLEFENPFPKVCFIYTSLGCIVDLSVLLSLSWSV